MYEDLHIWKVYLILEWVKQDTNIQNTIGPSYYSVQPVPDLNIGSIGWSLGPQNVRGLLSRCIIFLALLLDFHGALMLS
jgi:hypothetical protein